VKGSGPIRLVSLVLLCAAGATGCGKESPMRAIYEAAHELEHEDAEGVCDRLFPSTLLPVEIAGALGVPAGGHPQPNRWDSERATCVRELGRAGRYASFSFAVPIVRAIEPVAITPQDGITAAARARIELDRAPARTVPLIEFRGTWRIVVSLR
jgi:hypothetical protein